MALNSLLLGETELSKRYVGKFILKRRHSASILDIVWSVFE